MCIRIEFIKNMWQRISIFPSDSMEYDYHALISDISFKYIFERETSHFMQIANKFEYCDIKYKMLRTIRECRTRFSLLSIIWRIKN